MAIDKSLRQYYQDGEKVKKLKLVEMGEELTAPADKRHWTEKASEFMLNRHRITTQDIKDVKEGEASIPAVVKRILKRYVGMGEQDKAQGFNLAPKKLSSFLRAAKTGKGALDFFSGSKSLVKFFAPAAVAGGIAYLHKNRERFTGYPTQVAYEQARQGRINIDRIDMRSDPKTLENLEINLKREGLSDKEIKDRINQFKGETTVMKADVVGADIGNPNEMKNLDENFENIKYNIDLTDKGDEPSFAGEGYDDRPGPSGQTVAETAAMEDININQAPVFTAPAPVAPAPVAPAPVWTPAGNGGGGDRHGGGGGMGRGRDPGGGAAGSPFKKGGRIDKALEGRSRDI